MPQPSDDPNDPLNWSCPKKNLLLFAISIAAFQSDFQTAVGIPGVILQGVEWNLSPVHVNYAGNLNVLMKYVAQSYLYRFHAVMLCTLLIDVVKMLTH